LGVNVRKIVNCDKIKKSGAESDEAFKMKVLLCKLGKRLGFEVDIEEGQESELGRLGIRHDVLWYEKTPEWFKELLTIIISRDDLTPEYRELIKKKLDLERYLYAAFEIEATDVMTKAMKGDISNLSKLPYGIIVVLRGKPEVKKMKRKVEHVRNRFEKALMEFRLLHGPNNVIVCSFSDIEELCRRLSVI